jgi:hypothetical protein
LVAGDRAEQLSTCRRPLNGSSVFAASQFYATMRLYHNLLVIEEPARRVAHSDL